MISPELPHDPSDVAPETPRSLVGEVAELLDTPDDASRRPDRPHDVDARTKYYMDGIVTVELGPSSESLL